MERNFFFVNFFYFLYPHPLGSGGAAVGANLRGLGVQNQVQTQRGLLDVWGNKCSVDYKSLEGP